MSNQNIPDLEDISIYGGSSEESVLLTKLRREAQKLNVLYLKADEEFNEDAMAYKQDLDAKKRELYLLERQERRARRQAELERTQGDANSIPNDVDVHLTHNNHSFKEVAVIRAIYGSSSNVLMLDTVMVNELVEQLLEVQKKLNTHNVEWILRNIKMLKQMRKLYARVLRWNNDATNFGLKLKSRYLDLRYDTYIAIQDNTWREEQKQLLAMLPLPILTDDGIEEEALGGIEEAL